MRLYNSRPLLYFHLNFFFKLVSTVPILFNLDPIPSRLHELCVEFSSGRDLQLERFEKPYHPEYPSSVKILVSDTTVFYFCYQYVPIIGESVDSQKPCHWHFPKIMNDNLNFHLLILIITNLIRKENVNSFSNHERVFFSSSFLLCFLKKVIISQQIQMSNHVVRLEQI